MVEVVNLLERTEYINDLYRYRKIINLSKLRNNTLIISGATGMIGRYLIDIIMSENQLSQLNCKIIALGRSKTKASLRFGKYLKNPLFKFIECDITKPVNIKETSGDVYIIHAASTTHPLAYSGQPISTILTNIEGTKNLLNLASKLNAKNFCLLSSVEIYGENRGDVQKFNEDYCGYINCNTLRAGYPEAKRVSESLCQAYMKEKEVNISIVRLARVYGPTMLMSDSKALSQFIKNGLNKQDIVLKSKGNQYYSYIYVGDAVYGILNCIFNGENGIAYNIADNKSNIHLSDLAQKIADISDVSVVYDIPTKEETEGFSKATVALLSTDKASKIGFTARTNLDEGLKRTISILENMRSNL